MKLWQLMVDARPNSTGAAEREALTDFAKEFSVAQGKIWRVRRNQMEVTFVVTTNDITSEVIGEAWLIEHGDAAKNRGAMTLRVQEVPRDANVDVMAGYFGMDKDTVEQMLYEAYGVRIGRADIPANNEHTAVSDADVAQMMRRISRVSSSGMHL